MELFIIRLKGNIAFTKQYTECYFVCVIQSGRLTIQINNDRHILHKDQYLFIEIPHSLTLNIYGEVQSAYALVCDINFLRPYLSPYPLLFLYSTTERIIIISLKKGQELPVAGLLGYLWYRWLTAMSPGEKYTGQVFMVLQLLLSELNESLIQKPCYKASRQEQLFMDFLMVLKANKGKDHRIGYYASKLCISTNYLSKVIKRASGHSPRYFIVAVLLFESKKLLYAHRPIKEIAAIMGFSSAHHFSAFFSKYTGMSPSNFVRSH